MKRKIQLVAVFVLLCCCSFAQIPENGKNIVVHTVEEGQTVYSIASIYSLKPKDIQEQNPSIDSTYAIQPGQILRIELPASVEQHTSLSHLNKSPILHIVKNDETLYSLSKSYGVSVNTLQEWNSLSNNAIKIGQELTVGWKYSSKPEEKADETMVLNRPEKQPEKKIIETQPVVPAPNKAGERKADYFTNNKQAVLKQRFLSDYSIKTKKSEDGPAIWFSTENKMMKDAYYGLYSRAPVGSVVKVTNLRNNHIVFVKIIGSLPNTAENHGSMIKLTPAAKNALNTVDGKIRVRVDYAE